MTVMEHMATNASPAELFELAQAVAQVDPRKITTCVVRGRIGFVGAASVVFPDVAAGPARSGAKAREPTRAAALLSQTDSVPGASGRIRTCGTWYRKPVLYPLSYGGRTGRGRCAVKTTGRPTRSRNRLGPASQRRASEPEVSARRASASCSATRASIASATRPATAP